jgi:translation initiation factor 2B subunit (eIF-2B alpha/beta/delta family)
VTCDNPVVEAFRRAAGDRERGAGEIEAALIRELLELRKRWNPDALGTGAGLLAAGQPAMANLRSLAVRIGRLDGDSLAESLTSRADILETLPQRLADSAWPRLAAANRLVTLSRSSAVVAVVAGARARGWRAQVVVLDGTEAGCGPEQAAILADGGPTLSQPDATAPRWLEGRDVVVAVGADAVGRQRFVNCAGTLALLEQAAARGLVRMLVADTGKDVADEAVDEIVASGPLHRGRGNREWPIFEAVPMALITVRVSEKDDQFSILNS